MTTSKAFRFITLLRKSEKGAAAAEYALILAIVGSAIALAAFNLGDAVKGAIETATACIEDTTGNCVAPAP